MKFLLVLIVVLIGVWVWRSSRRGGARAGRRDPDADRLIDMVVCDLCGVHCPKTDLVVGERGVYCSVPHRDQAET